MVTNLIGGDYLMFQDDKKAVSEAIKLLGLLQFRKKKSLKSDSCLKKLVILRCRYQKSLPVHLIV